MILSLKLLSKPNLRENCWYKEAVFLCVCGAGWDLCTPSQLCPAPELSVLSLYQDSPSWAVGPPPFGPFLLRCLQENSHLWYNLALLCPPFQGRRLKLLSNHSGQMDASCLFIFLFFSSSFLHFLFWNLPTFFGDLRAEYSASPSAVDSVCTYWRRGHFFIGWGAFWAQ